MKKSDSIIDYHHIIEVQKFTPLDEGISPAFDPSAFKAQAQKGSMIALGQFNNNELIQMQEAPAFGQRQRSGFSLTEHKARMKMQMQESRDKSPGLPLGDSSYQVINFNQYNIYNGPVTNSLADDFLIQPEQSERKRRHSVVFKQ